MRMDGDVARARCKEERIGFAHEEVIDELFEEEAACGDGLGAGQPQFAVVLDEHRPAGGFEEEDRWGAFSSDCWVTGMTGTDLTPHPGPLRGVMLFLARLRPREGRGRSG